MRCRIRRVPGEPLPLPAFRRRAGRRPRRRRPATPPAGEAWQRWRSSSRETLPDDLQGVFLDRGAAAVHGEPCPSDAALARAYGSHSPRRARRLLAYFEERGLLVVRTDFHGRRVAGLSGPRLRDRARRSRRAGRSTATAPPRNRSAHSEFSPGIDRQPETDAAEPVALHDGGVWEQVEDGSAYLRNRGRAAGQKQRVDALGRNTGIAQRRRHRFGDALNRPRYRTGQPFRRRRAASASRPACRGRCWRTGASVSAILACSTFAASAWPCRWRTISIIRSTSSGRAAS